MCVGRKEKETKIRSGDGEGGSALLTNRKNKEEELRETVGWLSVN